MAQLGQGLRTTSVLINWQPPEASDFSHSSKAVLVCRVVSS